MARLRELKHRRRRIGKPRTYACKLGGKASPSLQAIQLGQNRRALCDGMGLHPNLPRHGQKNAPGLGLFFFDQPHQFVILLDGLERLQVDRLPARRSAMHHSGNAPLMLRLDRDHETLPADSDQVLLRAASFRKTAQGTAQALFDHSLLAFHLPPDAPQIGGRIIAQRAIGIEARPQRTRQVRQLCPRGQLAQGFQPSELGGHIFGRALDQRLPGGDVVHQKQQVADLFRLQQRSLDARFIRQRGRVEQPAQRRGDALAQQQAHLAHQVVLQLNPRAIPGRHHRKQPLARNRRMDETRHQLQQPPPLQRVTAALLHHQRNWF